MFTGYSSLPEILPAMVEEFPDYRGMLAYLTPGGQALQLGDRKINTFWKPVLLFGQVDDDTPWLGDVVRSATATAAGDTEDGWALTELAVQLEAEALRLDAILDEKVAHSVPRNTHIRAAWHQVLART